MKSLSQRQNFLPQLKQLGFNDHEAIAAIQSATNTGGFKRKGCERRIYELKSGEDVIAEAKFNRNFKLYEFEMCNHIWKACLPIIKADAKLKENCVAHSILYSYRTLNGFACIPGWLQIRPVACELKVKQDTEFLH